MVEDSEGGDDLGKAWGTSIGMQSGCEKRCRVDAEWMQRDAEDAEWMRSGCRVDAEWMELMRRRCGEGSIGPRHQQPKDDKVGGEGAAGGGPAEAAAAEAAGDAQLGAPELRATGSCRGESSARVGGGGAGGAATAWERAHLPMSTVASPNWLTKA